VKTRNMQLHLSDRLARMAGMVIIVFLLPSALSAQSTRCPASPSLRKALWQPYRSPREISVGLSDPILLPQSGATWLILDSTDGSSVSVKSVTLPPITTHSSNQPDYAEAALIVPEQPLAIDHVYYLFVKGLVFEYCTSPPKTVSPVAIATERPKDAKQNFIVSAAKAREDSDFYFAPTIDGASGTKASYTLDTKFQFRKSLVAPQFGSGVPYHPAIYFIPGWDIKISSNPKEDGNSVNFLVPLEIVAPINPAAFPTVSKIVTGIVSQPGFVAEADKKFHDVNGVFADYEYVVLRGFGDHYLWVSPEPMIGVETGANLKAQSANTYPNSILRADIGMHLGLNIFQAKTKSKPLFSIETDYIRRLLLNSEPTYTLDSKGNLILKSVGAQPRDHVSVKINYNLISYVALTAAYEYGELPPVYTKVDNKYTFGVTFLGQLQYRPGAKQK
jgi:hypothetical protein